VLYSVHGRIGSGIHPENEIRVGGGGGEGKGLRFLVSGRKEEPEECSASSFLYYCFLFPFFFSGGKFFTSDDSHVGYKS
jgi:hypothetical protein